MKEILKLYLEYKTKKSKNRLIAKALDQRKWIMQSEDRDAQLWLADIDLVINKILKSTLT